MDNIVQKNIFCSKDKLYMARCIELALNSPQTTSPNPMVGAVVVYQDRIIGEGYHIRSGEGHAEVNAIRSVKDPSLLKASTLYVSLEPCSHYGKTPPCTDLIISKQIPEVVIGCIDPFAKVHGRGIRKLQEAGVQVKVGILNEECCALNKRFITAQSLKRPFIVLKWAESADGYIDKKRTDGTPVIFSSKKTNILVHKRRAEADAIMVGTHTALLDDPSLTVRHWAGPNPIRIVIDRHLTLPASLQLFNDEVLTLVYSEKQKENTKKTSFITLRPMENLLPQILEDLLQRGIQSLLVEGGQLLLQSFINQNLWDEAYVEKTDIALHDGIKAPIIHGLLQVKHYVDTPFFTYTRCD